MQFILKRGRIIKINVLNARRNNNKSFFDFNELHRMYFNLIKCNALSIKPLRQNMF